jgi:hypothetical protein
VSLGGSLRASRAALLALPRGPLVAVDLADGRALMLEDLGAGWVACGLEEPPLLAPGELTAVLSAPARRRRLVTALALAGVLGASAVGLVTGFSGAPPPAVAQPLAAPAAARPPLPVVAAARARGGRAAAIAREMAPSDTHSPPPPPPAPPARPVAAPRTAPAPPRLPELPSVPAL